MTPPTKVLVFHTAFIGDIILTLPLIQVVKTTFPEAAITVVTVPGAAGILANHPAIAESLVFDKRRRQRGIGGMLRISRTLRDRRFDLAIVPHRSMRSALITHRAEIPVRIGFSTSAGRFLFTDTVLYDRNAHEIDRNLSLVHPLGISVSHPVLPAVYPSAEDVTTVNRMLAEARARGVDTGNLIAVAPGSVWNTKRWPAERFASLVQRLAGDGFSVAFVGGEDDRPLCDAIAAASGGTEVLNSAGDLTLLQSAELIRRCKVAVSNDSAPMHLAVAVRVPVVAIFGATAPQYGFAPRGALDSIVETNGLSCRPCAIHGGKQCPVGTFDCMLRISPDEVLERIRAIVHQVRRG
jgi:heptosyltransferase-2